MVRHYSTREVPLSPEEFISAYMRGGRDELKRLGMSDPGISTRCATYRKMGIELPLWSDRRAKAGRPKLDVAALNKLIEAHWAK